MIANGTSLVMDVPSVDSGPAFKSTEFGEAGDGTPLLRGENIEPGALRWTKTKTWPDQLMTGYEHLLVEAGDLILGMDRPVVAAGLKLATARSTDLPALLVQRVARIRPKTIDGRYLYHWLSSPQFVQHVKGSSTGTQLPHITLADIRNFEVPRFGDDAERRIVDLLEDHLSRLDAANRYLTAGRQRLGVMASSVLLDLIPDQTAYPDSWKRVTVADAGTVGLGRQRHPDWHNGPNMKPYLRVANVFEDRIDTSDVMDMHWPEGTFERFKLHPGDVLLNEGQTPDLLGRPAIYRGQPPETAFTNSLIRFRVNKGVIPEFALLVFRRHMRAGRFKCESRITTNIAHLSAARLKPIEFPIPPMQEQERIVGMAVTRLDAVKRLEAELATARGHQANLRRSLLGAAFSGRLSGSPSDLSVAEEMIGA